MRQHGNAGSVGRGSRRRLGAMFLDEHECSSRYVGMRSAAPMVPNCHGINLGHQEREIAVTALRVLRRNALGSAGVKIAARHAIKNI